MELNYDTIMLLVLVAIITYLLCFSKYDDRSENFANSHIVNDNIYLGHPRLNTPLTEDSLFRNVITYNNDDNLYNDPSARSAIDKCLENCPSQHCIEFGPGASALCFPPDDL